MRDDIREGHANEESPDVPHGEVHALGDASGIGDASLLGQLRVLNEHDHGLELATLFGVDLPAGATDETNRHPRQGAAKTAIGCEQNRDPRHLASTRPHCYLFPS